MEVGRSDSPKIGAIIQARMQSTRLPGKILMSLPYPNGKPLMAWIVESIKRSDLINKVVIATSMRKENDCLEPFAFDLGIDIIRGDENDVLSRFVQAIRKHQLDTIVRLTGDNPIVDVNLLDVVIQNHIASGRDYTYTTGLPIGMNFEIVSSKALLNLTELNLTSEDKEHVTLHIRRSELFAKNHVSLFADENLSSIRLTVDFPSDFALINIILSLVKDGAIDIRLIQKFQSTYPWIFQINEGNFQRKHFQNTREEILTAVEWLKSNGMAEAASILIQYGIS